MDIINNFREFWRRQSNNYKILLTRNLINRLGGVGGGVGGGGGGGGGGRYVSIFLKSLGAGYVEIGLLSSISHFVRMVLSLPSGIFIDRVKKLKRLYLIGRLLVLPLSLIYSFAQSWHIFIYSRVWEAVIGRFTMPAMNIINIDSYSDRDRVMALAITRTLSAAVGLLSPLLLAYIIAHFGGLDNAPNSLRIVFIIQFAVGVLTFLLLYYKLEEPEFERSRSRTGVLSSFRDIFNEVPGLYRLLLLNVTNSFFMQIRMPFTQLYFYEVKNATVLILGWQGTVSTAVGLLLSIPISKLADRIGRRKIAYIGRISTAFCVLCALFTPPDHPEFLLLYSFFSAIGMAMNVGWNAFQQEYVPLHIRGRWSGISTLATALVSIPAPLIGGYIWERNPDIAWWIGIFHYAFVSLPLMMSIKEREPVKEKSNSR